MTDRELLEDAAKAAGIPAQWDCSERGMMMLTPDGIDTMKWNPITDDGDALRLAVQLNINITARRDTQNYKNDTTRMDHYAATRRAIVRAAAKIGRGVARPVNDALPEDNYYKSMAEAEEAGRAAAEIGRSMK